MIQSTAEALAPDLSAELGLDARPAHLYRGEDGWAAGAMVVWAAVDRCTQDVLHERHGIDLPMSRPGGPGG